MSTTQSRNVRRSRQQGAYAHRMQRLRDQLETTAAGAFDGVDPKRDATLDCGWGRLLFGQTFDDPAKLLRRVVLISSWRSSELHMLRSMASRWLLVRLSFLSPLR